MNTGRGIIAGVGHPSSCEIYHITGNKKVRLGRIIDWERKHEATYPRLSFRVTKSLKIIKRWNWKKAEMKDHLKPYKCVK